jgi:hypothetical protein
MAVDILPGTRKSPVFGAVDYLSNNAIGQCTKTRYICIAQIITPAHKFLDVSAHFWARVLLHAFVEEYGTDWRKALSQRATLGADGR